MKKQEKTFFVENLKEQLKSSTSVVVIDYSGLSVKMQQDLKKRLKKVDAEMIVVKNTLFKLASKDTKIPEETTADTVLSGQTAIVITEKDALAPLQILAKFAKEFEILQFKVGVIEGKFQDKENLLKLAQLPSRDILLGQVAGTAASPINSLLNIFIANSQKLIFILTQASKK